jgi:aminoglycoside phosphotransferase (APT) family kinase protein
MSVVEIDDGYDFKVAILDNAWVVRIPRRSQVFEALEREVALLPELAAALPVKVPRFELVSREPLFVVYRLIEGQPLVDEDSDGVRAFVETLHALETDALPRADWAAGYGELRAELERLVLPLLDADEQRRSRALLAETDTLGGFEPCVIHADLGPEHLLVHDGVLHGVIDWGDARLGDPALDYAWLLNGPFPDWDVDDELRRRARFYHRLGPWHEAHYGLFTGRDAHVERGLAGIRARL